MVVQVITCLCEALGFTNSSATRNPILPLGSGRHGALVLCLNGRYLILSHPAPQLYSFLYFEIPPSFHYCYDDGAHSYLTMVLIVCHILVAGLIQTGL